VSEASLGPGLLRLGLIGSPNSGKTTIFNALTGLRAKVGNYPGVTVERREGELEIDGRRVRVIDLRYLQPHADQPGRGGGGPRDRR